MFIHNAVLTICRLYFLGRSALSPVCTCNGLCLYLLFFCEDKNLSRSRPECGASISKLRSRKCENGTFPFIPFDCYRHSRLRSGSSPARPCGTVQVSPHPPKGLQTEPIRFTKTRSGAACRENALFIPRASGEEDAKKCGLKWKRARK